MMPGIPKAKVKSRVILTPQHAKRLMRALNDNISKFEGQFGEIKDIDPNQGIPMNFQEKSQDPLGNSQTNSCH